MRFAICSLVFWTSCVLLAQTPADKPNIVVILVDDMGFSDLGCYGSEIPTPNLDALAADGLKFTQFYNTGRCCPTRASLLTGLYPHQAGVGHMTDDKGVPGYRGRLNDSCVTIAEVLKPAGYFTIMSGKWHVGQNLGVTPWGRGFDRSLNPAAGGFYYGGSARYDLSLNGEPIKADDPRLPKDWYSTDLWTTFGLKFIDEALAEKKPFYLHLCHNAPHFPLQAPADAIEKFRGKYKAGWGAIRDARYAKQIELGIIDKEWAKSPRPKDVKPWAEVPAEEKERFDHLMAVYAACVFRMDKAVGDLVAGLKERGVFDNTLILFMSDNGGNAESGPKGRTEGDPAQASSNWFCGESWAFPQNTPFRLYKHYNHEGGIATPLIAHWPARGGVNPSYHGNRTGNFTRNADGGPLCHTPAHLIDIMATCVDVAGATYPTEHNGNLITPMEGKSLRNVFLGDSLPARNLFWEHEGNAAVRVGDMKLVRKGRNAVWELYNLKSDRTELHDLATEQPEKAKELAALWEAWAERAHVKPFPNEGGAKKKGKGKKKAAAPK
ncbi:MAG TPA: arylsulfatase [Prosthecobacter sp.]|nr:arylsulfatase [Prosthecobacter sp.]